MLSCFYARTDSPSSSRRWTSYSPNGQHHCQIDYILVRKRFRSGVNIARTRLSVLDCPQIDTEDDHPILRKEVEAAVQSTKKWKSGGVDKIPAELVQAGGEDVITALTTICDKIWQTREWPTLWTQSLAITLPKKDNLQQCQNCNLL